MSKKKKKIKIPKSVLDLRMSPKKFAKKHNIRIKGKMSKKEKKHNLKRLKNEYSTHALGGLNKAVKILVENADSTSKKVLKVQEGVDNIISNPGVMKKIAKIYKKSPAEYPNMKFLPRMITATLLYYRSDERTEEEKELAKNLDTEELLSFCEKILKKEIKRYRKFGLSDSVAYQMAICIPTSKLFNGNRVWYKNLIQQLYELAADKDTTVDVDVILKAVSKIDKKGCIDKKEFFEGFYSEFIMRRSTNKDHSFNDNQKELHETLLANTLDYLEGLKPRKLREILKQYIKRRKTAEEYKNDGKRAIKFIEHANSSSPYKNIKAVVQELIDDNANNELYLS